MLEKIMVGMMSLAALMVVGSSEPARADTDTILFEWVNNSITSFMVELEDYNDCVTDPGETEFVVKWGKTHTYRATIQDRCSEAAIIKWNFSQKRHMSAAILNSPLDAKIQYRARGKPYPDERFFVNITKKPRPYGEYAWFRAYCTDEHEYCLDNNIDVKNGRRGTFVVPKVERAGSFTGRCGALFQGC